ncbi:MAG: Lar family restriction alleviation protein [Klebsiella aerogenes]|nr:Lar family restriction alleviation protein [Klebsiella aerogenes]
MPEVTLLPCPACGASDVVMRVDTRAYVFCTACGMCGPCAPRVDAEYAIRQWNALPRALTWTDEPPKVPGYYWRRYSNENTWSPAYICIVTDLTQCGTLEKSKQDEWAGPIPEPREPK